MPRRLWVRGGESRSDPPPLFPKGWKGFGGSEKLDRLGGRRLPARPAVEPVRIKMWSSGGGMVGDAKRVFGVLGKRFARYGLTLRPAETRFVDFRNNGSNGTDHPEADGTQAASGM